MADVLDLCRAAIGAAEQGQQILIAGDRQDSANAAHPVVGSETLRKAGDHAKQGFDRESGLRVGCWVVKVAQRWRW